MERKKILIIEDNPMNMQLAADLLELGGYAVLKAETAEAGIHLAETQSPDLILMDISLPGMNGLEAAAVLKKKTGTDKIPIVALTAHAMKGDEEQAREAGCRGYISKPIDTRSFAKTVAGFLNG